MPVPTVAKMPAPTMLPKPSAMSAHGPSARRSFGLVSSAVSLASASKLRVTNKPADAGVLGGRSGAMAIERLLVGSSVRRSLHALTGAPLHNNRQASPALVH